MSSTNRGATRAPLDAYYTPDAVARACVATVATDIVGATVLEPHAGGAAFVRALQHIPCNVWAMDISPQAPALAPGACLNRMCGDFLTELPIGLSGVWSDAPPPDWIVGNPPFGDAEAHVRRALDVATVGVGFLLRLAFLEGSKRRAFWRAHPPAEVHVLVSRPSFTGGATDSAAYGWFIWRKGRDLKDATKLHWLDWRKAPTPKESP